MSIYHRILAIVDLSAESASVVARASQMAAAQGAALTCCTPRPAMCSPCGCGPHDD